MAPRIPDKKCHGLQNSKYFWCVTNVAGSHLGPVTPSAAVDFSLGTVLEQSWPPIPEICGLNPATGEHFFLFRV